MPAPSDIANFAFGQLLQTPALPKSLTGKTIVITALGASIIVLGCRSLSKGEAAKKNIELGKKMTIHGWQVDMADYSSVMAFAERLKTLPSLDAVIANAAISTNQHSMAENFESTLTVNVVSTFLLALLVLPQLRLQSQSTHLVIVGSNVHSFADRTQLQKPPRGRVFATLSDKRQADMSARYFLSKLMVMLCVRELASKTNSRVIINCPSPGWCKTELSRQDDGGFWGRNMLKLIGRTAEVGARCLTSAIAAGQDSHGKYLSECRVKQPSVFVRSEEGRSLQRAVWEELMTIIAKISPDAVNALEQ